ncbi:MAG: restriction endonuclease subunit S [Candidatus Sabulitectum sp.]|nr:restriction endonuclease subunit S [Candidatus Sabulitectum sp.]
MKDKNMNRTGYKKTKVGWIPEEWKDLRLEAVCGMKSGESITSKSIFENAEYRCYGGNGPRGFTKTFTHDGEYILIGRQGALCGNIHLVSGKIYVSEHAIVTTTSETTDLFWLAELLKYKKLNRYTESSAQPGLSVSKVLRMRIPLPPLPEQKAIASVLESWDKAIQRHEEKIEKKKNIKKGLMQKLLSGKQRLPGFDGEWKDVKTTDIMSVSYGKDWKAVAEENGPFPVYGTGGQIGTSSECLFESPAILLGRKGTIDSPRYLSEPFWAVDTTFAIHCYSGVNTEFIFSMFQTIPWKQYNEASGVPSLSRKTIENLHLILPCESEQKAIASVLSSADSEIKALKKKLALLRDQKKFLLNNLVTGTIRLPEFCKEVG